MHPETGRRAPSWPDGKATAGVLVGFALLLIAGAASQLSMIRLEATSHRVARAHEVLRAVDGLRAALFDAEAGQRGFLLSGDPALRDACRAALRRAEAAAAALRALAVEDPAQEGRIDALQPLLRRRLAVLSEATDPANGPVHPAAERPMNDEGKQTLDELRALLVAVRDAELAALTERSRRSEAAGWWLGVTTAAANLLALLAAVGAVVLVGRSTARRRAAEEALHRREEEDRARERAEARRSQEALQVALVESREAQRAADELVRGVFAAAPVAFVVLDPAGRVRLWNPAAERLLGWGEAEVLGQACPLGPAGREGEFHELMGRVLAGGTLLGVETRWRGKDGRPLDVSVSAAPLRGPGTEPAGVLIVLADVAERKTLEAEVRRAQKLEAVGRLAGGIAHDFNNLLTVINGCSDLLRARLPDNDPGRELLDAIAGAGDRAARLTRQLLAFGRRQTLRPRGLDLNAIIADLGVLLGRLIGEDVTLETDLCPGTVPVVGDRGQLEQVVMNLALNARDAMPRGGRLTIATSRVEHAEGDATLPAELRPGPYVRLTVSDTGTGIDAAVRAHLCEPFFTTKGPGKGTGLGLATAFAVVQQAGGALDFATAPGAGTTVSVYLPWLEQSEPAAEPEAAAAATIKGGGETILLVEDEARVRKLVRDLLRGRGYTVLEAGDGAEALRVAAAHPATIHLLVTDVVMPRLSGRALAEHLTALRPSLKVLYLSGYTDDAILRHGVQEGAALLAKPFTPEALVRRVREALAT